MNLLIESLDGIVRKEAFNVADAEVVDGILTVNFYRRGASFVNEKMFINMAAVRTVSLSED